MNPWPGVIRRTVLFLLIGAVLGGFIGQLFAGLFVATAALLAWHLLHLYRLERWLNRRASLRGGGLVELPSPDSIWSEIFGHILTLKQRSRKRKRKFTRLLKQFKHASAAVPSAVVVLDANHEVEWCNAAATALLGLHSPQDIGQPIIALVRNPALVEYLNAENPEFTQVEFPSPVNHEIYVSVSVSPYGKKQLLLMATDVSRLHRLEQTRQDFVANVSHELRTPLTVVGGYLETLLDTCEDSLWRQPLLSMQQQAARMLTIIEDLLLLSRLETASGEPQRRPVPMPELLESVVEDAEALSAEQAHRFELSAEPDLWLLGADQELRSAVSNLVFNAVRYSPPGSLIRVCWWQDETGPVLAVEDQGEGIPEQHIPRLTERFYRVDRSRSRSKGSGSGLGLAIVKHVLQRHEAELRVQSQLGVGSVFACRFPPERAISRTVPKWLDMA